MRILLLSGLYPPHTKGGAELSAHYLAQGLRQLGHDVIVMSSSSAARDEKAVDGVPIIRVPLALTAKPLFEKRWAQRQEKLLAVEMRRHAPFDVIHCHDFRCAQIVSQMNLRGAVVTVRDYAFICGSPNNILADGSPCPGCEDLNAVLRNRAVVEAPLLRKPGRIWQYWYNINFRQDTLRAFQNQIYISHAQQSIIERRLGKTAPHTAVLYNPVPAPYLTTRPVRPLGQTILYAGIVESYKGVGLLLEAFRALTRQWPNIHLKIVGEGAQRRHYEQQVAQWGLRYRVNFVGRISPERMQLVYDEAAYVVAPHLWDEPFGRTVVEAMARERIVIAANAGGPGEIIQPGVTGIVFARGSRVALQAAFEYAWHMSEIDRREMQRAARRWVTQNLTIDHIARQHETFYATLI